LGRLKDNLAADDKLVRVGSEFSTREILTKELYLIRAVNAGVEAVAPFVHHYEPAARLGPDQRKALAHVLTSPDRFTGFRGLAGSGKSTALLELAGIIRREGFKPLFCAPTASAADTLRKDGMDAMTLQRLHGSLAAGGKLSPGVVIVLDEAGAVGLDDMVKLFELARRNNCRVVLSGDTGQHSSVPRGDALRIIEQYSSYRFSELTTIRRQKPAAFREIVELAAAKQMDKAFAKLVELGAVTEVLADGHHTDNGQLYQRAADAYVSATKQGRSALLVSPTWAEIEAVTEKVRESLRDDHQLAPDDQTFPVFDSLSWTVAQKKNASQFEPGQRLRFVRRTKKFEHGETVEVVAVAETGLRVRRPDGMEVDFIPSTSAASFDVGESRELKVAAGDWLLLQANHGKEFINGERVQVKTIQDGRIALADGRTLPAGFNTFTHGYAVTSHSSQGKTVDEVLLVASSKSFPAVNREQFYVSISRGRERVHVFTDDSELLARRITDSHERKAAIELQALRDDLAQLGFTRKPETPASPAVAVRNDFRTMRPMRSVAAGRADHPQRATRLSPVQRLAQFVKNFRRWLLVPGQPVKTKQPAPTEAQKQAAKVEPTENAKQAEKQAETISPAAGRTPQVRPNIKLNVPPPRRSRGIGH
jgi:ATP-dependent exoDNAse (exonuclease V) alpha subunit